MTAHQLAAKKVALEKLAALKEIGDVEIAHSNADDALCELLKVFDCADVVVAFNDIEKWYA